MQKAFPASVPGAAWPYPKKRADGQQKLMIRKEFTKVLGASVAVASQVLTPPLRKPQISFCLQT